MSVNIVEEHIARRKLVLKDVNTCVSFFTTSFRGEAVMLAYDNLNNTLMNFWGFQELDPDDIKFLEKILREYYN